MRVCTFRTDSQAPIPGLLLGSIAFGICQSGEALGHDARELPGTVRELIEEGPAAWEVAEDLDDNLAAEPPDSDGEGKWWWKIEDITFEVPHIPPKNPWVVGANYYRHLANGYARIPRPAIVPAHPEYFTKSISSLNPHNGDIVFDKRATQTVDYETELCVVIGKKGRDLSVDEAADAIFGYTVTNDTSARELQLGHRQYYRGKGLDSFCPVGPAIVTTREIDSPYGLTIKTRVNGELRQNWPVGDMIYKVDLLVATLSEGMTIEPGDMLICGTVPGTGFEQLPQTWLQHGDVVESEITKIGVLRNTVRMAGVER